MSKPVRFLVAPDKIIFTAMVRCSKCGAVLDAEEYNHTRHFDGITAMISIGPHTCNKKEETVGQGERQA